jgi:peptidoglycan/xylan/chitin deacetylase (PgdA/CDA1 family)
LSGVILSCGGSNEPASTGASGDGDGDHGDGDGDNNGDGDSSGDGDNNGDGDSSGDGDGDSGDGDGDGNGDGDGDSGDGDADGGDGDDTPGECDLGPYKGTDHVKPSKNPPCDLKPEQVPMFVSIGFDDNDKVEGLKWALDMTKKRGIRVTFFDTSMYGDDADVLALWKQAREEGHEVGNHTRDHLPDHGGIKMTAAEWKPEIEDCTNFLLDKKVVDKADLWGFRTPYLEYSDGMLSDVDEAGFRYDASIEEGNEDGQDGTNFYWPYTLDDLSPGHTVQVSWEDSMLKELTPHKGLWELPVYAVFVPENLRAAIKKRQDWFDVDGGQITGFDYNLWSAANEEEGGFEMSKDEFLATLKNSFDLHYAGNRAPFLFGAHTGLYVDDKDNETTTNKKTTGTERREAIEEFLDYVLDKKDVKVVPFAEILTWLRNPKPL